MHEEHIKRSNINYLEGKTCEFCVWSYFILNSKNEFEGKYCRFKSPKKLSAHYTELNTYQKCPPEETCQFWKSKSNFLKKYNNHIQEVYKNHKNSMVPHYNTVENFTIYTLRDKVKEFDE